MVLEIFFLSGKKKMKIQRISTDVRQKVKTGKYNTGVKNCWNIIRGSTAISHINMIIGNNNDSEKRQLKKSIDSNKNLAKNRLSKTSDISRKKKKNKKNDNKTKLINRVNMNKNDINNPFF